MKIFAVTAIGTKLHRGMTYLTFNSIDELVKDEERHDQVIFAVQDLPANFDQQLDHARQRVAQQERQKQLAKQCLTN
jgi:hypothetical protein